MTALLRGQKPLYPRTGGRMDCRVGLKALEKGTVLPVPGNPTAVSHFYSS